MSKRRIAAIAVVILLISSSYLTVRSSSFGNMNNSFDVNDKNILEQNEVRIITNMDKALEGEISEYNRFANFPITVYANNTKKFSIMVEPFKQGYTVEIIGNNNYGDKVRIRQDKDNDNVWEWDPDRAGIFKIVVKDNGRIVAERKVYVNNSNGKYLQLKDIQVDNSCEDNTVIKTTVKSWQDTKDGNNKDKIFKFVVGEYGMWYKTIRDYGEKVKRINSNEKTYYVDEESDDFKFNKGIYDVGVFAKDVYSIEFEDVKFTKFRKKGLDGISLSINPMEISKEDYKYNFEAVVNSASDNDGANLEYAFLQWDQNGLTKLREYTSENTLSNWSPSGPGRYVIYARVRQKPNENEQNLLNSYEAQAAWEVVVKDSADIKIEDVELNACVINHKANKNNPEYVYKKLKDGTVLSHEMNYIVITASSNGEDDLYYKAYVTHDGYMYSLGDYSKNNVIPFYAKKDSGEYTVTVLAKGGRAGSDNDKQTLKLRVIKN